jgi:ATP-dependent RNA helicase SUPV3L1/SUV3
VQRRLLLNSECSNRSHFSFTQMPKFKYILSKPIKLAFIMNLYFLVMDSQNRLVFKTKLKKGTKEELLMSEYQKLDFVSYILKGKTFAAALSDYGITLTKESAFLTKKELKETLYFTDKKIHELLGQPDLIVKLKGSGDKFAHLYSKTRVQNVLESSEYKSHAEKLREKREKKKQMTQPLPEISSKISYFKERHSEKGTEPKRLSTRADKEKLKHLVSKMKKDWNLNEYKDFFSVAREQRRKHVFLVGPTNSGKSYRGFNELALSESGAYLSPLRLLALEGQEEIEKRGKECSLLTGEEMEIKPGTRFVASTIEMVNLDKWIDCVLIDEVQIILDKNRGWAWSQAIVGIPAKKLIMTGSEECLPTLKRLIEDYLEEELEIVPLCRIGKFEIHKRPTHHLAHLEPGTAVIAFSRRSVLAYKKELEDSGRKVSVLYGNLSPGVRREEARRFRSGETDILVATDCIGMGLNLPIKTVLFSQTAKFDGRDFRDLTPQEAKQISGRAGRYGKFECGYVGATNKSSLTLISEHLQSQQSHFLEPCVVRPTETQLLVLREQIGHDSIKNTLSLFVQLSTPNSILICSDLTEMLELAKKIEMRDQLNKLSFSDKYVFISAPVPSTETLLQIYISWLISYSKGIPVTFKKNAFSEFSRHSGTNDDSVLNEAENCVKILMLYHWLARRKSKLFPSLTICEELREQVNTFIENSLKKKGLHRKCPSCSRKLPVHHVHKICDNCFSS